MNKIGIERVMEAFGINANSPTRVKELKTINLRSNGNQSLNPRDDVLTFDVDNELIKIKEYKATAINGFFINPTYDGNNTLKFDMTVNSEDLKFRKPRVGDILASVKLTDNSIISMSPIVSIKSGVITISKKLTSIEGCYFTYIDSEKLEESSNDILKPKLRVIYTPLTKFKTDIYIGFDAIVGFSAKSEYCGI